MGNQIRDHHARSIFDHLTKEPPRLMSNADSELPAVTIYTDGACSPNPGPGGWGAVVLAEDRPPRELSGYGGETTNNRMELTGVIEALAALERPSRIDLYTDSQYVKNGITSWIESWRRRNWRTADNRPVKNVDLWQRLLAEIERHRINWHWVRGHAANRWNERADALAVMARKDGVEQLPTALEAGRALQSPPPGVDGLAIYTGVTCKHSSGLGAWAVIMIWRGHVKIMGERVQGLTANQLYLRAVTTALSRLTRNLPVTVFTHSGYLKDGAVSWLPGWRQRNWQTREGTPVSNRELWQELDRLLRQHQIAFQLEDKERPLCLLQEAKELAREFEQEESR